mmetsp:Transcript_57982/g.186243  ORF Transcript_57982/g.186243 Transcript_57982/m.186243 type:complete len:302 (+) Transcript_57982:361-1266(+)
MGRRLELDPAPDAVVEVVQELATKGLWVPRGHEVRQEWALLPQGRLEVGVVHALRLPPDRLLHHVRVLPGELAEQVHQVVGALLPVDGLLAKDAAYAQQGGLVHGVALAEAHRDDARRVQELQLGVPEATYLVPRHPACRSCPVGLLRYLPICQAVDDGGLADVWEANHHRADRTRVDALPLAPAVDVSACLHELQAEVLYGWPSPLRIDGYDWHPAVLLRVSDVLQCLVQALRRNEVRLGQHDDTWLRAHPGRDVRVSCDPGDARVADLHHHVNTPEVVVQVPDGRRLEARPPIRQYGFG